MPCNALSPVFQNVELHGVFYVYCMCPDIVSWLLFLLVQSSSEVLFIYCGQCLVPSWGVARSFNKACACKLRTAATVAGTGAAWVDV